MVRLSKEQIKNLPEWIPVIGFEGLYEVNCREGIVRNAKTLRVLKPKYYNGYPYIGLRKDGKVHTKTVHRIVANAAFSFYNISTDGLCACHLDETRTNSCIDNLALGTTKENSNFPKARKRRSEAQRGKKGYWFGKHLSEATRKKISDAQKKAVAAYKNGTLTLIFNSIQLTKVYGFNCGAVSKCCHGKLKTHKGLEWRYFDKTTAMTV